MSVKERRTGLTVISIVTGAAHRRPGFGVNVYRVVLALSVLIFAGLHVPLIPLSDAEGNNGAVEFWHNGPICVNVGRVCGVINTSIVVLVPHWFAVGVKA